MSSPNGTSKLVKIDKNEIKKELKEPIIMI
jgi:hypothetical protein